MRPSAVAGLALLGALAAMPAKAQDSGPDNLSITASPLPVFDRQVPDNRFGALTYVGGLSLSSTNRNFEALSGLTFTTPNRLLMVTDEGYWLSATLVSDADGTPRGLDEAHIGPLLDTGGAPMLSKRFADAESVTVVDGEIWVASENDQPLRAYALQDGAPTGPARLPAGDIAPLDGARNAGIEAMVHVSEGPLSGQTLVFLEEPLRSAAQRSAAAIMPDGRLRPFQIRRLDGFAITGAAMLPGGDVIIVERRFSWNSGLFMRLRHLPAGDIASGAVEGRVLLHADGGTVIDNMEGIAISDHPDGPILTLISDDNGNFFQRSVLLRFQLTGDVEGVAVSTPPAPVARPDL